MKNLVITLNFGNIPSWASDAKTRQFAAWVEANKGNLPFENLIILPDTKENDLKLYWLEGAIGSTENKTALEAVRDQLKPVLCALMTLDVSKDDPKFQQSLQELKELRLKKQLTLNDLKEQRALKMARLTKKK